MSYNSLFLSCIVCVLCLRALSAIDWPIREVHLSTSEAHSVCKQAVWLIIRPVQFTLWWSNFSSLKNIQDSHTGTSPLSWGSVPLCSAVSHEVSMATRQDMEWHEYNGDLWNCYYNQTKQNKTKQTNTNMPSSLIARIEWTIFCYSFELGIDEFTEKFQCGCQEHQMSLFLEILITKHQNVKAAKFR